MQITPEQKGLLTKEYLTGYEVSKLTSTLVGRYVREQMVYNYMKNGMIKTTPMPDGKRRVSQEQFRTWFSKFGTKNGVKVAEVFAQV
jgi:hypothetical protein